MRTDPYRLLTAHASAILVAASLVACGGAPPSPPPESGSVLWTRQIASPGRDFSFAVATAADGRIAVVGSTFGALAGASNGGTDAFLVVLDGTGDPLWSAQLGTPGDDQALAVAFGPSGELAIGGVVRGPLYGGAHAGDADGFVRVYEADGSVRWTRQFGTPLLDYVSGVAFMPDGDVVAAGSAGGALDGGLHAGQADAFVRRHGGNDGSLAWSTSFGTAVDDYATDLAVDPATGTVWVVGATEGNLVLDVSHLGDRDAFLMAFDPDGVPILGRARQFGSSDLDVANSVAVGADGDVAVAGYTRGALPGMTNAGGFDMFVRVYDASLDERWTRQAGTPTDDFARTVAVGPGGVVALAGETRGSFGGALSGETDAFVRTYAPNGDVRWARLVGTPAHDIGHGVAFLGNDAIVTSGFTEGALEGPGAGDEDVFVRAFAR